MNLDEDKILIVFCILDAVGIGVIIGLIIGLIVEGYC